MFCTIVDLNFEQLVMRAAYVAVDGPGDAASVREQINRFVQQRRPNQ